MIEHVSSDAMLGSVSPILGDPSAASSVAVQLKATALHCDTLLRLIRTSQQVISTNSGKSITAIDSKLSTAMTHAALSLAKDVQQGQLAFHTYGEAVRQIHEEARNAKTQAERLFASIQSCALTIESLCAQLAISAEYMWNLPPPLEMPAHFRSDGAVTLGVSATEPNHSLHARYVDEWRAAATSWHSCLGDVHELRNSWQRLYEQRLLAEQAFVTALMAIKIHEVGDKARRSGLMLPEVALTSQMRLGATNEQYLARLSTRRSHPLLVGLHKARMADYLLGRKPTPFEVERWWWGLSERERQLLVDEVPLVIGNLDGVPLDRRIAANAVSAGAFAGASGISSVEAAYWQKVHRGEVKLVVSDPERSRIIEMVGSIGPQTEHVITYVPGTGAQMKHFYRSEAQQVVRYIDKHASVGTVAFVFKDGPWVSWVGSNRNTSYDFLGSLGSQVAEFQRDVIDRDSHLIKAPQVAMGHSAGMSVISGAELSGAKFDQVISLGGSFMLDGWQPRGDTTYHHFQYDNDVINRIDDGRLFTPNELNQVYLTQIFPSEGKAEMQSHSRIVEGPKTNENALKEILQTIEKK